MAKLTPEQLAKLKELGQKLQPLNVRIIGFYYVR